MSAPQPKEGAAAARVDHLVKRYGRLTAVDDLSFDIAPGEIFGLLGPNGAGKTTTIGVLTGLVKKSSGTVEAFGYDVARDARVTRRLIGLVPQEISQDQFFPIEQGLAIQEGLYGADPDPAWREEVFRGLHLWDHRRKTSRMLSGGMKRRYLVAKALVHKPKLLILDEPTAGVDVELRKTLWEFVRHIHALGTTILLTTHYLEEAEALCHRIGILNDGRFVALDKTAALLDLFHEKQVVLDLERAVTQAPEALAAFQPVLSEQGTRLTLRADGREHPSGHVLAAACAAGLAVRDVTTKQADLEDVFLSLTSSRGARP